MGGWAGGSLGTNSSLVAAAAAIRSSLDQPCPVSSYLSLGPVLILAVVAPLRSAGAPVVLLFLMETIQIGK